MVRRRDYVHTTPVWSRNWFKWLMYYAFFIAVIVVVTR
jgi:hypothetical protein